ncbi:sensor histidine kinase [Massilia sp. TS11]|uniref:sensor histidine kinase n=1 Tax=Massilia sp. TS11 TaxID=2908003 RepID=UPI001EDC1377|nr:sensor histidine kinase [Massilia sp. TS11]MCG2584452.1 sensor histidine kinase [Massilia sp. TS11]
MRAWWRRPWLPASMGKSPYLWLVSLCFFFWKYAYVRPTALELLALAASLILFMPLYFYSHWVRGARSLLCVLLTTLLAVLWTPHNMGASSLYIFACAMCAGLAAPRAYVVVGAVIVVATLASLSSAPVPLSLLIPVWVVGISVGVTAILESSLRRSRESLLRKQEEVEHMARIAERERISRDLHDLLGHTLSLISIKAELAGKLLARDPAASQREIQDIEATARRALAEVRAAVTGFRQAGFAQELANAAAALAAARIEFVPEIAQLALPPAVENVMSLALREAVTNIVRHAGATRCELALQVEGSLIVFRIRDNGAAQGELSDGNGLRGMRERVAAIGGHLAVRAEQGLALELRLPLGVVA